MIELGESKNLWYFTDDYRVVNGEGQFISGGCNSGWNFAGAEHCFRAPDDVYPSKAKAVKAAKHAIKKMIAFYEDKLKSLK